VTQNTELINIRTNRGLSLPQLVVEEKNTETSSKVGRVERDTISKHVVQMRQPAVQ